MPQGLRGECDVSGGAKMGNFARPAMQRLGAAQGPRNVTRVPGRYRCGRNVAQAGVRNRSVGAANPVGNEN